MGKGAKFFMWLSAAMSVAGAIFSCKHAYDHVAWAAKSTCPKVGPSEVAEADVLKGDAEK